MPHRAIIEVPHRRIVALLGAALVLLAFSAWGLAGLQAYEALERQTREQTLRMADVLLEHAEKTFETLEVLALQVTTLITAPDDDIRARQADIASRLKMLSDASEQLLDIWVLDAQGKALVTSNFSPTPDVNLADRKYFFVHRDGLVPADRSYIGDLLRGRADPNQIFYQMSTPWFGLQGEFRGVIALSVEPRYFRDFYARAANGVFAVVSLTREDGSVLSRHPQRAEELLWMPLGSQFMKSIRAAPDRGLYETVSTFDSEPRIVAYRKLAKYPVYVTVSSNIADIAAPWRRQAVTHLYFGVPALFALLALIYFGSRQTRDLHLEIVRRQALMQRAHETQRLEALGRLSSGVTHDFNNLVSAFSGALRLMEKRRNDEESFQQALNEGRRSLLKANDLTRRLLAFARDEPALTVRLDANPLVLGAATMAKLSLPPTVRLQTVTTPEPLWIETDANLLENALLNLCINARDAMPHGGEVSIEVIRQRLERPSAQQLGLPAGHYCVIAVRDSGTGMPPDVLRRASDPFFTTKPVGIGTGLGLSQVHALMQQCEGKLSIESEVGVGTVVRLFFPQSAQQQA
jgi:two-component system NtrC family sensor kinase